MGKDKVKKSHFVLRVSIFLSGLGMGLLVAVLLIINLIPSRMIVTDQSVLPFDETVQSIKEAIEQQGWVLADVKEMNKSIEKHGVDFEPRVTLVELCHPQYAKAVLESNRDISTMMPCTIAVWEGDDGNVYVSRMNLRLMAKLFGGTVAEVMGGSVVKDEAQMLAQIIQ